jgi:hypothetical protein
MPAATHTIQRDEFDFSDLTPIEIPVTLPGGRKCILREGSAADGKAYQNFQARLSKVDPETKTASIVGNAGELESLLVSKCLYECDQGGSLRRLDNGLPDPRFLLPMKDILALPNAVVSKLYAKALRISGFEQAETEEALVKRLRDTQEKLEALQRARGIVNGEADHDAPGTHASSQEDVGDSTGGTISPERKQLASPGASAARDDEGNSSGVR